MAWMPGASRVQTFSGNRHRAPISKIVLHTTEGSSWPWYGGGGYAPHFTVHRDGRVRQHIDTAYSAKALENDPGGVQTNNAGVVQIEYIGSCDRSWARKHGLFFTEDADDDDLAGLASVLAWIHAEHDVPLVADGLSWPTSNAAYEGAPQRFSYSQWNRYSGVCGHTHVPENAHWDPGNFPVARLLRLAGGAAPSASRDPDRLWVTSPRVNGMSDAEVRSIQQTLADLGYDLGSWGVDGSYGDATGNAVKALQHDLDTTTDGIYGPGTEKALMSKLDTILDKIDAIPREVMHIQVPLEGRHEGQSGNLTGIRKWYAEDFAQVKEKLDRLVAFGEQNQWRLDRTYAAIQKAGKAQGLTDEQVKVIADAAAEAVTAQEA